MPRCRTAGMKAGREMAATSRSGSRSLCSTASRVLRVKLHRLKVALRPSQVRSTSKSMPRPGKTLSRTPSELPSAGQAPFR